eukprot:9552155-Alexandrium_andersonii.AAC.1
MEKMRGARRCLEAIGKKDMVASLGAELSQKDGGGTSAKSARSLFNQADNHVKSRMARAQAAEKEVNRLQALLDAAKVVKTEREQ